MKTFPLLKLIKLGTNGDADVGALYQRRVIPFVGVQNNCRETDQKPEVLVTIGKNMSNEMSNNL